MKKPLFYLSAANLLIMLGVEFLGPLYVAVGYGVMFSKYRELDLAKAVDYEILRSEFALDAYSDWGVVVEYLAEDFTEGLLRTRHLIALFFGLNSVVAFALWRWTPPTRERA